MSDNNPETASGMQDEVPCDNCGTIVKKSEIIIDKGMDYPEEMQSKVPEGRDHLRLCQSCNETIPSNV